MAKVFSSSNNNAIAHNTTITCAPASGRLVITGARICFGPSAYDGSEAANISIVLEVTDEIKATIQEWEQRLDPVKLSSAITTHGIRAKLDTIGVMCWHDKQLVPLPDNLNGDTCNTILEVHGIWSTNNQSGFSLQRRDIEIIPMVAEYPF